jgi:hypothetical protein
MKILTLLFPFLMLGCVTIPIPPFGESRGELGDLQLKVSVNYVPKSLIRNADSSELYAWEKFKLTKPKLLKDK